MPFTKPPLGLLEFWDGWPAWGFWPCVEFASWVMASVSSIPDSRLNRANFLNLQVFATDDHHARLVAALSLFRANGPPPVRRAPSPCLIADVSSDCARGEDGIWRFRSHVVRPVFLGSDHPLSLSIDGQFLTKRASVSPKRR